MYSKYHVTFGYPNHVTVMIVIEVHAEDDVQAIAEAKASLKELGISHGWCCNTVKV